jgi:2-polyprenyl-3-methyl-5-hydroxy-6-metoxy-1,4-benzoquinol methylase
MNETTEPADLECSLCGKYGRRRAFQKESRQFYECAACKHIRVFPYPTDEETKAHYERSFTTDYLSQNAEWFRLLAATRLQILKHQLGNDFRGSLLDVGSGYGFFLKEAKLAGWQVLGIETSPSEYNYSTGNFALDVLNSDIQEALVSLASASFDVVSFWHVLEHLEQPGLALKEAKRLLKEGGLLVINSPNLDSAAFRLLGPRWSWIYVPGHLQYLRAKPFADWLQKQSLTVHLLETWTHAPNLYFMLEEALLLAMAGRMEKSAVTRKVGQRIRTFVYSAGHQQVVQARLHTLYRWTPYLDRYLISRSLGHEFLLLASSP